MAINTDYIDKAFQELINQRGIHNKLGITSEKVRQHRYNLNNGQAISTDLKLRLLQKSGWRQEKQKYPREDLISLIKFTIRTSQKARDFGAEYVLEKWEKNH